MVFPDGDAEVDENAKLEASTGLHRALRAGSRQKDQQFEGGELICLHSQLRGADLDRQRAI